MPQDQQEKWHVGKEVPLAVLFTLMVQTGGGIWWLAQVSSKIDYAVQTLQTFQAERYTREDARRDKELMLSVVEALKQKESDMERRIGVMEGSRSGLR
jgi:hypothetical protein